MMTKNKAKKIDSNLDQLHGRPLDWDKMDGLLPAIVQDADDGRVLMLGYMNRGAVAQTHDGGLVTFYSRSKKRLWVKGETSGHHLRFAGIAADCDGDTLLVQARPRGPACHTGAATCFDPPPTDGKTSKKGKKKSAKNHKGDKKGDDADPLSILADLVALIATRDRDRPAGSYTTSLFEAGLVRLAQKVGEEGLETALAAAAGAPAQVIEESADLIYHLLVLLQAKGVELDEVLACLGERMGPAEKK